jgi:hypothetical protein
MRVYRYLSAEHALLALQTKKWKLGRLRDLNDPFDCQPLLENAPDQGSPQANGAFARDYLRALHLDTGLLSYSARIDDPVIWSHYADSHRGIALGFEYGERDGLMKVDYSEQRARIDYLRVEELRTKDANRAILDVISKGFTVKAPSWKYEHEYRHFLNLWASGCEMEGPHYFRPVPQLALRVVILGARCSVEVEDVRRLVYGWQRLEEVRVVRAVADAATYRINA